MRPEDEFLDDQGNWKCTSCGACCAFITPLVNKGKLPRDWLRKDGSCQNLDLQSKQCAIYDDRPDVCRVDHTLRPQFNDLQIAKFCAIMKAAGGR